VVCGFSCVPHLCHRPKQSTGFCLFVCLFVCLCVCVCDSLFHGQERSGASRGFTTGSVRHREKHTQSSVDGSVSVSSSRLYSPRRQINTQRVEWVINWKWKNLCSLKMRLIFFFVFPQGLVSVLLNEYNCVFSPCFSLSALTAPRVRRFINRQSRSIAERYNASRCQSFPFHNALLRCIAET